MKGNKGERETKTRVRRGGGERGGDSHGGREKEVMRGIVARSLFSLIYHAIFITAFHILTFSFLVHIMQ